MSRRSGRSKVYLESNETTEFPEDDTNNYEAEPEDEIEEEQEVTRCICGQDELQTSTVNHRLIDLLNKELHIRIDQGLFIQCDKCSVWQHGYCVGLFTNDEVPDKYWCEICKPDIHLFIYDNGDGVRTLYKPVNEKRKKISIESLAAGQSTQPSSKSSRSRPKRQAAASASPPSMSAAEQKASVRKERRHYDDSYDEQLQKALRESAKESGVNVKLDPKSADPNEKPASSGNSPPNSSKENVNSQGSIESSKRRIRHETSEENFKKLKSESEKSGGELPEHESDTNDQALSNLEDDQEDIDTDSKHTAKRPKSRNVKSSGSKSKKSKPNSADLNDHNSKHGGKSHNGPPPLSKDELTNQASKPRYVSDKLSIYELRKRTGAILEWLGRSQIELEEEKLNKIELFNYKDSETESQIASQESEKVIKSFDENLRLMETLTENILNWEQKFGKYAP